jgi:hypothetical protein
MLPHKAPWCCEWCAWRYLRRLRRLIHRGLEGRWATTWYVVLTAPGGDVDVEEWNRGSRARLKAFIRGLRQETGSRCDYFATWELQKRGALHVNLFVDMPFVARRRVEAVAVKAGWGFRTWIERVGKAHVRYAVKMGGSGLVGYVTKDSAERHLGGHRYSFSRGWLSGGVRKGKVEREKGDWSFVFGAMEARLVLVRAGFSEPLGRGSVQARPPPGYAGKEVW